MELEVLTAFAKYAVRYYHGSATPGVKKLRPNTYVTPYKRDAATFGVPWSTSELKDQGAPDGRPPRKLKFKNPKDAPADHPIYVYEAIKPKVQAELTNTGAKHDWNRVVTEETSVKLVKKIPSWKKALQ